MRFRTAIAAGLVSMRIHRSHEQTVRQPCGSEPELLTGLFQLANGCAWRRGLAIAVILLTVMACTPRDDGSSQSSLPARSPANPQKDPQITEDAEIVMGHCRLRLVHGLNAAINLSKTKAKIAYIRSGSCMACESLDDVVGDRICANNLIEKTVVVDLTGIGGSSVPKLQFLDEGRIIDEHLGAQFSLNNNAEVINRDYIDHFLIRNNLIRGDINGIESRRGTLSSRAKRARSLSGEGVSLIVMDGEDLSGWKLKNAIVGGCSLRGTDLRNADLSYSYFTHTDLTGAKLDGARMEDVRWNHVTCPDGQFSLRGPCGPGSSE